MEEMRGVVGTERAARNPVALTGLHFGSSLAPTPRGGRASASETAGNDRRMTDIATSSATKARGKIEDVLASIRPAVRADGGDIEFVGYDAESGLVTLRMVGACYACPMAMATLRAGVEQRLRMVIPEVTTVEAV